MASSSASWEMVHKNTVPDVVAGDDQAHQHLPESKSDSELLQKPGPKSRCDSPEAKMPATRVDDVMEQEQEAFQALVGAPDPGKCDSAETSEISCDGDDDRGIAGGKSSGDAGGDGAKRRRPSKRNQEWHEMEAEIEAERSAHEAATESVVAQELSPVRKILSKQITLGVLLVSVASLLVFAKLYALTSVGKRDELPAVVMMEHSKSFLHAAGDDTSEEVLHDKLQFSQMTMNLDTQVFTAPQHKVQEVIQSMCDLPEQVCKSMMAAAVATDVKYHKKKSVPLDENVGSYLAVWMWVKTVGDGQVQVAFKSATLSYRLRDVVTYKEQIDEEPDVRCTLHTERGLFGLSSSTSESCRQIGMKRSISQVPVFKQAVMNPKEMQLVDTMMERMLAKKVLENSQGPVAASLPSLAPPRLSDVPQMAASLHSPASE